MPESLRAENLAALEFVDYVLIDKEETPIKNIKLIKPNFYVKGYEYNSSRKNNPKTLEEKIVKFIWWKISLPREITYNHLQRY